MRSLPCSLSSVVSSVAPTALLLASFALVSLLSRPALADELTQEKQGREREEDTSPFFVGVDAMFGFRPVTQHEANVPEAREEESQPRERSVKSFIFSLGYDVNQHFTIGARLPLSIATFEFTEQEQKSLVALGNLEIAPSYDLELIEKGELTFELGLALPIASGDEFAEASGKRRTSYANLAAARSRGFRDNALFASHRFGIIPGVEFELERGPFELSVFAKLEILAHAGGSTPPAIEGKINNAAVELVTGVELFGAAVPELLTVGAQAWIAHTAVGEVKYIDVTGEKRPGDTQVVLMPEVRILAGKLRSDIGFLLPLGGPLGDWKYKGVRTGLSAEF